MDGMPRALLNTFAALIAVAGFTGLAVKIFTTTPTSHDLAYFWVGIALLTAVIVYITWDAMRRRDADTVEQLRTQLHSLARYTERSAGACRRSSHRLSDAIAHLLHYQDEVCGRITRASTFAEVDGIRNEISDRLERTLCDFARTQSSAIQEKLQQYDKTRGLQKSYRTFVEIVDAGNATNPNDVDSWEVVNAMMDPITWERVGCLLKKQGKRPNPVVADNPGFRALAVEQRDIFVCNNLDHLPESAGNAFIEIDPARPREYKAICMLPICSTNIPGSSEIEDFYGFLVIDCTNNENLELFSDARNAITRNLLAQEADDIAVICSLLKLVSRDLFGMTDAREACLRGNRRHTDPN